MGKIAHPAIPDEDCTLSTCSLEQANIQGYLPSLAGNAFYCGVFGLILILQLLMGVHYRTWGFMIGMVCGILLEVIGYIGRIQMHFNPFTSSPFLMEICCLTIGPAFLSASVYLCLARIIVVYGESLSRFKPRTYTITFMTCDFISLLLQAAGGAIASSASPDDHSTNQMGINIMVAGVSFQVFSLGVFSVMALDFAWSVHKTSTRFYNPDFANLRATFKFQAFLWAIVVATTTILIRSIFRCAELSGGFDGKLANDQVTFMVLEGAMIAIAVISLTVFHPGLVFQGRWADAGWSLRQRAQQKTAVPIDSPPEDFAAVDDGRRRWYSPSRPGEHGKVIPLASRGSDVSG